MEKAGRTDEDIASDVLSTLYHAEKEGHNLDQELQDIVGAYGWTEDIAKAILVGLEAALKNGASMGQAMKNAFDRAINAAEEFVEDHPVFCTLVALGILVVLAPWAIEALGFGELGPIEGSFAAAWQSRYARYVPKGSLFSFFQQLGMKWPRTLEEGS
ncbi:hypothetical protein AOQ84DRAFT_399893 [Glonium stellatum]|uniref:Uncharacterized protein n=1 Tax=Glonium stellatum TaxID=574774 RepID=A0A8E2JPK8_9PEZI|nr:hypothetical protein AOQ84DRAFT_399893 [Glonium stellatum]